MDPGGEGKQGGPMGRVRDVRCADGRKEEGRKRIRSALYIIGRTHYRKDCPLYPFPGGWQSGSNFLFRKIGDFRAIVLLQVHIFREEHGQHRAVAQDGIGDIAPVLHIRGFLDLIEIA